MDNVVNFAPARFVDPNEPGLLAAYTMSDLEISQFGKILNRANRGGAAYDLTLRAATPKVGYRGGIYCVNEATSLWRGAVVPVTPPACSYTLDIETLVLANNWWTTAVNGTGPYHSFVYHNANGQIGCSFNSNLVIAWTGYSVVGRGNLRLDAFHDGVNANLAANGRLCQSVASPTVVPAGNVEIGRHGEQSCYKIYDVARTLAQARASYVREFAKRVVYHWQPSAVGEGPAGGIPSGAVGEGDWSCPLGGANLKFVWVNDLSLPAGGFLALTDDGALSMRRLDFMIPRSPMFGSWLVRYRTRNTAAGGDCPRIGLIGVRGADMTAAGSQSIWFESLNNGGGWWRTQTYRENAGLIGVDVDINAATVPNGDDCATLLTHHVDGNFRIWEYSRTSGGWFWRLAAVVNDVNFLSYGYISIAPRGSYIKSVTGFAGEFTPHEGELVAS